MARLIAKKTKKTAKKVARRLDREYVTISLRATPPQSMTAGEALVLGERLLAERKDAQVVRLADQLAVKYGDVIDVHLLKMRALLQLEWLEDLVPIVDQYLKLAPDNIPVLLCAVQLNIILGEFEIAEKHLIASNRLSSNNEDILLQAAALYRFSGNRVKARKMLEKCLAISKRRGVGGQTDLELYVTVLSRLARNGGLDDQQYSDLRSLAETAPISNYLKSQSLYGLADVEGIKNNMVGEVELLGRANKYEASWLSHNISTHEFQQNCQEQFESQLLQFPKQDPDWLEGVKTSCIATPILILGMPRSGTTLIEQILGSHSKIGQTGESKAMAIGIGRAYTKHNYAYTVNDFPKGISKIPLSTLSDLAAAYVKYQKLLTHSEFYVDKEIANFKFVGLAANILPTAKFIHMNRAPMDIFLSCYKNSIPGIHATTNLEHLAITYIYMKKLIGYWLKLYPERVYIVDYANLVADPENQVKEVFGFLDLPFEPECLDFHKRTNMVRTISTDQVKQGIYQSSVDKWRPYEEMLKPAIKILEQHGVSLQGIHHL